MTNKDAMAILRNMSLWNTLNGDECNALKKAIKALENEQNIKKAIAEIQKREANIPWMGAYETCIDIIHKHIK